MSKQIPKAKPKGKATPRPKQRALVIPRHFGTVSPTAWTPPAKTVPLAQWAAAGKALGSVKSAVQWWCGDWWSHGSFDYGERCKALAESGMDLNSQTMMNYATVCRAFQTSRRREVLSFSHHVAVAALPAHEADKLLDLAERQKLSSHALRELVAKRQAGDIADAAVAIESDADDIEGEADEINPPPRSADEPHDHGAPAARASSRRHTGDKRKLLMTFAQGAGMLAMIVNEPAPLFVGTSLSAAQLRTVAIFLEHVAAEIDGRVIDGRQDNIAAHLAASLAAGVRVVASEPH